MGREASADLVGVKKADCRRQLAGDCGSSDKLSLVRSDSEGLCRRTEPFMTSFSSNASWLSFTVASTISTAGKFSCCDELRESFGGLVVLDEMDSLCRGSLVSRLECGHWGGRRGCLFEGNCRVTALRA